MRRLFAASTFKKGLVSIVMPTYRGAHSLGRAIESVLAQNYDSFELIVVDDNSPDSDARASTMKLMDLYKGDERIHYVCHLKNLNGSAARNTGINESSGEYIAFLDDDDVLMPGRISASVAAMCGNPSASMLFCDILHVFDDDGHMNLYVMDESDLTPEGILLNEAAVGTGSNLFCRRSGVLAIDGFDPRFQRHQDLEFSIRMLIAAPDVVVLHEPLVIKGYNGISNVPAYGKLNSVKELYNNVFNSIIEELKPSDADAYWRNLHLSLYRSALRSNNYSAACMHLEQAVKHGWTRGLKEYLQLTLARLGIFTLFVKDNRAATISNGTNAEVDHMAEYEYYHHMGDLAACRDR